MSFVRKYFTGLQSGARAFVTGPGVVDDASTGYMEITGERGTADWGSYLQTSNSVYVAARLRAQLLSSLPIAVYKVRPDGRKDKVTAGPIIELLSKVNPYWTFERLMEMVELSLCLWGEAYIFLDRGTTRRQAPRELWWARPDRVRVVPDTKDYISHFLYELPDGKDPMRFERDEVIWLRYPNPLDEFSGLSPLQSAAIAADTSRAAQISNRMLFSNGIQMAGVVVPKSGQSLTEEQATQIERSMARRFKGQDKAHRWGVLRFDASFQPLSVTPKDAEYLGSLKWSLEEICRAYGVPLDLVGGERTYANQHDARLAIWSDTILPEARFIANELTEQLLPMFAGQADLVEFDSTGVTVLQEAEAQKWAIEKEKLDQGVMLPNEWRASKGMEPLPWGNAWWAPTSAGGIAPVTSLTPPINGASALSNGTLTVNEARKSVGLDPVPWGDTWWAPAGTMPVNSGSLPESTGAPEDLAPQAPRSRAIADVDLTPPESVAAVARRALDWKQEGKPGGTSIGLARANQLANRENLSPETIARMVSYFARHEVDKGAEGFSSGEDGFPSPGRVAWDLWGGDPGRAWAEDRQDALDAESEGRSWSTRAAYGSPEHVAYWTQYARSIESDEKAFSEATADLLRRQRASILAKLKAEARGARSLEDLASDPFELARWVRTFRVTLRPIIRDIFYRSGAEALDDVLPAGASLAFDLQDPRAVQFIERQAQRFATQVNETTWNQLRESLAQGLADGEDIDQLSARVSSVMDGRIRSTPEAIARTEVNAATNGAKLEGWRQSGVVKGKRWSAAIDNRTRDSHISAHSQYQDEPIAIDEDFVVGGFRGPTPGQIAGSAAENVNCRCTMQPISDVEWDATYAEGSSSS
jgi:HK97 family phage portal protein